MRFTAVGRRSIAAHRFMPDLESPLRSRPSRWEWMQAFLLIANLVWTTLANGGFGHGIAMVTGWLTCALLVVHCLAQLAARPGEPRIHPAGWLFLPFVAMAAINVFWITPVRWIGWRDWLGWSQMITVFWVALNGIRERRLRRAVFFALVVLGVIGVVLGCYQRFIDPGWRMVGPARPTEFLGRASGSFSIPNSFAGFLLLVIPPVVALAVRRAAAATERIWWGWVALVLGVGLVLSISRGAWVALAVALTVWPLVAGRGGWRRRAGLALGVLLTLAAGGAIAMSQLPSVRQRFTQLVLDAGEKTRPEMWRGAWRLFCDRPILGQGAGSYNVLFERHRTEGFRDEPLWAHNEYLNTLSDYGLAGFGLFFGAAAVGAAFCVARSRRERSGRSPWPADPVVQAGFGASLLAFGLQLALDFHFRIPALAVAFAVVGALVVGAMWPPASRDRPVGLGGRLGWLAVATGAVVAALWHFQPLLEAEALRSHGRQSIDRLSTVSPGHPEFGRRMREARRALQQAAGRDPQNGQAWSDLAYATVLLAHVEPARTRQLGREAEIAANRALALAEVCSEFWVRRGMARDAQGRWAEAGDDFAAAVNRAPADATTWVYYADHLLRLTAAREAGEAALGFALRLDPGNPAGLTLRQRLAIIPRAP
jgi:O-antigen ligase